MKLEHVLDLAALRAAGWYEAPDIARAVERHGTTAAAASGWTAAYRRRGVLLIASSMLLAGAEVVIITLSPINGAVADALRDRFVRPEVRARLESYAGAIAGPATAKWIAAFTRPN